MPYAPPKVCSKANCRHLTPCPEHPRSPNHRQRNLPRSKVYDTKRWQMVRAVKLANQPQCETCGAPATDVDHHVPLRQGGAPYDQTNLVALCHPCHSRKTALELGWGRQ